MCDPVLELKHLYDTTLHGQDPLASFLRTFKEAAPDQNRAINDVAKRLLNTTGWAKIVQCWLDMAFPQSEALDQQRKFVADWQTCTMFIKFQYELYKDPHGAEDWLTNLCREKKFNCGHISRSGSEEACQNRPTTVSRRKRSQSTSLPGKKKRNRIGANKRRRLTPDMALTNSMSKSSSPLPNGHDKSSDSSDRMIVNPDSPTTNKKDTTGGSPKEGLDKVMIEKQSTPPVDTVPLGQSINGIAPRPEPIPANTWPAAMDESMTEIKAEPFDGPQYGLDPHAFDEMLGNWLFEQEEFDRTDLDAEDEEAKNGHSHEEQDLLVNRPKAPLPMYPPIWAQSRQEVCESFGWFRSYQGGVYFTRDIVKGYLLGGFSASRDRFEHEGRLIISHGGGKSARMIKQMGQSISTPEDDQHSQDKSVRALLRTYQESRPVVLVIDDRYALFPFDLASKNVYYAVLGFYTIAHAWAEYQTSSNEQGRVVRYKFAFRWCEGQGTPWWIQEPSNDMPVEPSVLVSKSFSRRAPVKVAERALANIKPSIPIRLYFPCPFCRQMSPKVYIQGWACLNPECRSFWITKGHQKLPDRLDYNPKFLELTQPLVLSEGLVKGLKPTMARLGLINGFKTNYASTRGWHCSRCGRLSCRSKWERYECAHCQLSVYIPGHIRPPEVLRGLHVPVPFQYHYFSSASGITLVGVTHPDLGKGHGRSFCHTFQLPCGRGFIHHIKPSNPDSQLAADQVFQQYQEQALSGVLPFRRSVEIEDVSTDVGRGPLLTSYFSQNCGVPYQYVGGTANTLPWDRAPDAVVNAKRLIQSQVSSMLNRPVEFNEVLSAAYMERQRMAFHSDGEPGLGPLVAGLSLGSPALMHFRLLAKYEREQRQVAISFVLRHGDVLVMDGAKIQDFYEHTVIPSNFRIAATARYIDTSHISTEHVIS